MNKLVLIVAATLFSTTVNAAEAIDYARCSVILSNQKDARVNSVLAEASRRFPSYAIDSAFAQVGREIRQNQQSAIYAALKSCDKIGIYDPVRR